MEKYRYPDESYDDGELEKLPDERVTNFLFLRGLSTFGTRIEKIKRLRAIRDGISSFIEENEENDVFEELKPEISAKMQNTEDPKDPEETISTGRLYDYNVGFEEYKYKRGGMAMEINVDKRKRVRKKPKIRAYRGGHRGRPRVIQTNARSHRVRHVYPRRNRFSTPKSTYADTIKTFIRDLKKDVKKECGEKVSWRTPLQSRTTSIQLKKDRTDLLSGDELFDFSVVFANKTIQVCKSFISTTSHDIKEIDHIKFEHGCSVSQSLVNDCLFGLIKENKKIGSPEEIYELWKFFHFLKMKDHVRVIGYYLSFYSAVELLRIFSMAFDEFEKRISDEQVDEEMPTMELLRVHESMSVNDNSDCRYEFEKNISWMVFLHLKEKRNRLLATKKYFLFFDKLKLLGILSHGSVAHKEDPDSERIPITVIAKEMTFNMLHKIHVLQLFRTKAFTNLKLKLTNGKEMDVHQEILRFKLNFFNQMIKFRGSEYTTMKKENEITIDTMSEGVVKILLSYAYDTDYLRVIRNSSIPTILELLGHCEMYFMIDLREETMKLGLFKRLSLRQVMNMMEDNRKQLNLLPQYLCELVFHSFTRFSDQEVLKSALDRFQMLHRKVEMYKLIAEEKDELIEHLRKTQKDELDEERSKKDEKKQGSEESSEDEKMKIQEEM